MDWTKYACWRRKELLCTLKHLTDVFSLSYLTVRRTWIKKNSGQFEIVAKKPVKKLVKWQQPYILTRSCGFLRASQLFVPIFKHFIFNCSNQLDMIKISSKNQATILFQTLTDKSFLVTIHFHNKDVNFLKMFYCVWSSADIKGDFTSTFSTLTHPLSPLFWLKTSLKIWPIKVIGHFHL